MGSVKDIWEIITGVFRRKSPAEYKQWQDITKTSIDEMRRMYEGVKQENERLKNEVKDLQIQIDHYKRSKGRNIYE